MAETAFPGLLQFGRQSVAAGLERCARSVRAERTRPARLPDTSPSFDTSGDGGPSGGAHLVAIDATCGNGHDTLFLAEILHRLSVPHSIFSFDIQQAALDAARARLEQERPHHHAVLLLAGHERLGDFLAGRATTAEGTPMPHPRLATVMYNLGFLPGGDKHIITRSRTSIASLLAARRMLMPHGLLAVHAYGGHPGGLEELRSVDDWFAALPFEAWAVARYSFCNRSRNPEVLFLAEKRGKA